MNAIDLCSHTTIEADRDLREPSASGGDERRDQARFALAARRGELRQRLTRLQFPLDLSGRYTEVASRRLQSQPDRTAMGDPMSAYVLVVAARAAGSHRRDSTASEQRGKRDRERDLAFESAIHDPDVAKDT